MKSLRTVSSVLLPALVFILFARSLHAQLPTMSDVDRNGNAAATGPLPDWDVAVVKPHAPDDRTMSWQMTDDSMSLKNLSLGQLICAAWDVKPYQLSGLNGWMKDSSFDLTAKVSSDDLATYKKLSTAQRLQMLQRLLAERFKLKLHNETKTLPLYNLVVDKGGSKLKPTTAIEPPSEEEAKANPDKYRKGSMMYGPGMFDGTGVGIHSLTSQLANVLEKPVNDQTDLKGLYDIKLRFRKEQTASDNGEEADKPPILTAVQEQLGLKLVPDKGPVETLVVDAAQPPEAN
jgi:uncharacterized protein (TIGR03435 family)